MHVSNILLALWLVANFGSFIWSAFTFFKLPEGSNIPTGTKWLSYLVLCSQALITFAVFTGEIPGLPALVASVLVLAVSTGLFWWCLRIHGKRRLTAAYASDLPEHLVKQGPYNWIRHPFYTAYMLSYIGGFIAVPSWWALPAVIIPLGVYYHASRFEEQKFEKSRLAESYALYRKQAGRFLPRLIRS